MKSLPTMTRKVTPSKKRAKRNAAAVLTHIQIQQQKQQRLERLMQEWSCGCRF